jgi:sec-independent protein translocase protein TatA
MHSALLGNVLGADGLIVIVVLVIVLLFGGSKLPKLARGLGSASHEFRKGVEEGDAEAREDREKGAKGSAEIEDKAGE